MGTFQGMETFEKITKEINEKGMDAKVLDSIYYVEKTMFFKRQRLVRILFFRDFIEVAFSKYMFPTAVQDDNIPYVENYRGKYEDIITYVKTGNSITFYGNFVETKKERKK